MGNVNVAGNLEQFSDEVAGAFGELSRRLELEFNLGSSSASFSSPSTSREATRSRSEARAEGGPNLLTPNFCHALFLIADYLTVEECFRVLVLDQSIHSFLSSHAFTWKMLFRRLCLASGEDARYEAERVALAEKSLSPTGEVQYLQQRILHHFQDRLNYEHQHFQTLLNFDRVLYQYCATFKPTPRISTHGVFGMSSNLLKFRSRAIAECLSLCRKNAARVCVMETIMHPPTFKKSIPRGVLAGQASVSYLTLDMAQAQASAAQQHAEALRERQRDGEMNPLSTNDNAGMYATRLTLPDLSGAPGFIGYACDLCELRPEHEELGLRDTVCWSAFMHLAVFETQALGEAYEESLPAAERERFWCCGLDYTPPADRQDEPRFRRGYNFAYGDEFRPLLRDMVRTRRSPDAQIESIRRKLELLHRALELSSQREQEVPPIPGGGEEASEDGR